MTSTPRSTQLPKSAPFSGRVGAAQMRAANMGLILRHLRAHGSRSRAQLASETGLSKATMSSLIGDLTERGLVREGDHDRGGAVGRPGLLVNLDGRRVAGLGVEINVDYVALTAVDLTGVVIRESTTPMDVPRLPVDAVLDRVATLMGRMLTSVREAGYEVVAWRLAPPGVIDYDQGAVRFAANLGWRSVSLVHELSTRLGPDSPPIGLENDAKLGAVAEYAFFSNDGVQDLVYVSGDVGVGAGIIAEGQLLRGWSGFSGEVGHLPLGPPDRECSCGRSGCWELMVGLAELLRLAADADDDVHDPTRPLEDRLMILHRRAEAGEERTLAALDAITQNLAAGLSILVDVLNPRVLVLGGYFAHFGDFILAPLERLLEERRMDAGSGVMLATSQLGLTAAARGGAIAALEAVFEDPTVVRLTAP